MFADVTKDKTIVEKVDYFVKRYYKKFEITPEKCHVNKDEYEANKEALDAVDFIEVIPDKDILLGHFWIGIEKMTFQDYSEIKDSGEEYEN